MNKFMRYGFGAIALYLVVYYASGAGTVLDKGSAGAGTVIRAFQGRK